jgi:chemotaxis response regulator CheB
VVVGIGASAGGLDAFRKLLAALPPDSGMAFYPCPAPQSTHESMIVDLLAAHTSMVVRHALPFPIMIRKRAGRLIAARKGAQQNIKFRP